MKLNGIDHYDHFSVETIFWAEISDVPGIVQNTAEEIDGDEYNALCFGMCVCYDWAKNEFAIVTDRELSTDEQCNIYYIDNDGDKHWFKADIPDQFSDQVFAACDRINAGKDVKYGYEIQECILYENRHGFVLAENAAAKKPFAVCPFTEDEKGRRDYFKGEYHSSRNEAAQDFAIRSADYQRFYDVREVKRSITEQMKEAAGIADNPQIIAKSQEAVQEKGPADKASVLAQIREAAKAPKESAPKSVPDKKKSEPDR